MNDKPRLAAYDWDSLAQALDTNGRPVRGARGYYRVKMCHGVSTIDTGNRYTLGIIFHDAS